MFFDHVPPLATSLTKPPTPERPALCVIMEGTDADAATVDGAWLASSEYVHADDYQ